MDTETGEMIVKRVSVPIGLEELMEGLVKEVLLKKPDDIYLFAARYFAHLLTIREKVPVKKVKNLRTIQTLKEKPEKPVNNCRTPRLSKQFSIREDTSHLDSPIISQKPKMYQRNELKYKRRNTGPSTALANNQQLTVRRKYARSVCGEKEIPSLETNNNKNRSNHGKRGEINESVKFVRTNEKKDIAKLQEQNNNSLEIEIDNKHNFQDENEREQDNKKNTDHDIVRENELKEKNSLDSNEETLVTTKENIKHIINASSEKNKLKESDNTLKLDNKPEESGEIIKIKTSKLTSSKTVDDDEISKVLLFNISNSENESKHLIKTDKENTIPDVNLHTHEKEVIVPNDNQEKEKNIEIEDKPHDTVGSTNIVTVSDVSTIVEERQNEVNNKECFNNESRDEDQEEDKQENTVNSNIKDDSLLSVLNAVEKMEQIVQSKEDTEIKDLCESVSDFHNDNETIKTKEDGIEISDKKESTGNISINQDKKDEIIKIEDISKDIVIAAHGDKPLKRDIEVQCLTKDVENSTEITNATAYVSNVTKQIKNIVKEEKMVNEQLLDHTIHKKEVIDNQKNYSNSIKHDKQEAITLDSLSENIEESNEKQKITNASVTTKNMEKELKSEEAQVEINKGHIKDEKTKNEMKITLEENDTEVKPIERAISNDSLELNEEETDVKKEHFSSEASPKVGASAKENETKNKSQVNSETLYSHNHLNESKNNDHIIIGNDVNINDNVKIKDKNAENESKSDTDKTDQNIIASQRSGESDKSSAAVKTDLTSQITDTCEFENDEVLSTNLTENANNFPIKENKYTEIEEAPKEKLKNITNDSTGDNSSITDLKTDTDISQKDVNSNDNTNEKLMDKNKNEYIDLFSTKGEISHYVDPIKKNDTNNTHIENKEINESETNNDKTQSPTTGLTNNISEQEQTTMKVDKKYSHESINKTLLETDNTDLSTNLSPNGDNKIQKNEIKENMYQSVEVPQEGNNFSSPGNISSSEKDVEKNKKEEGHLITHQHIKDYNVDDNGDKGKNLKGEDINDENNHELKDTEHDKLNQTKENKSVVNYMFMNKTADESLENDNDDKSVNQDANNNSNLNESRIENKNEENCDGNYKQVKDSEIPEHINTNCKTFRDTKIMESGGKMVNNENNLKENKTRSTENATDKKIKSKNNYLQMSPNKIEHNEGHLKNNESLITDISNAKTGDTINFNKTDEEMSKSVEANITDHANTLIMEIKGDIDTPKSGSETNLVERVAKNYVNYVIENDRYLLSESDVSAVDEADLYTTDDNTDNNTESKSDEITHENNDLNKTKDLQTTLLAMKDDNNVAEVNCLNEKIEKQDNQHYLLYENDSKNTDILKEVEDESISNDKDEVEIKNINKKINEDDKKDINLSEDISEDTDVHEEQCEKDIKDNEPTEQLSDKNVDKKTLTNENLINSTLSIARSGHIEQKVKHFLNDFIDRERNGTNFKNEFTEEFDAKHKATTEKLVTVKQIKETKSSDNILSQPANGIKKATSFDSSKLREELKEVEKESKFTNFKSSFNPFLLHKELDEAVKYKKVEESVLTSMDHEKMIEAILRIQAMWRGFKTRQNLKNSNKQNGIIEEKLTEGNDFSTNNKSNGEFISRQKREINNSDEDFINIAKAAVVIQRMWRKFKLENNYTSNEINSNLVVSTEKNKEVESSADDSLKDKLHNTEEQIMKYEKESLTSPTITQNLNKKFTMNSAENETALLEETEKQTIFRGESTDSVKKLIFNDPKDNIKVKPDFHNEHYSGEVGLILDEILDYPTVEEESLLDNFQNKLLDKISGKQEDKFDDIKTFEKIISPKRIEDINLEQLKDKVHIPLAPKNIQNVDKSGTSDRKVTRLLSNKLEILKEEEPNDEEIKEDSNNIPKINPMNEGKSDIASEEKLYTFCSEPTPVYCDNKQKSDEIEIIGTDKNEKSHENESIKNIISNDQYVSNDAIHSKEDIDNITKPIKEYDKAFQNGKVNEKMIIPLPNEVKTALENDKKQETINIVQTNDETNLDNISSVLSNAGINSGEVHNTIIVPVNEQNIETDRSQPISVQLCQTPGQVYLIIVLPSFMPDINQDAENMMTSEVPSTNVTGSNVGREVRNAQDPGKADLQVEMQFEHDARSVSLPKSMESGKRRKTGGDIMEAQAATKIQAGFRGYQVRKQLKLKNDSSDMNISKKPSRSKTSGCTDIHKNQSGKSEDLEEQSAVKIQAGVRGFLVRRRQKKHSSQQA